MWPLSNSAPTCVRASSGSPTRIRHISSASFAVKTSATGPSTTTPLPPTHPRAPHRQPAAAHGARAGIEGHAVGRVVQIGVGEHDVRVLAAELQAQLLDVAGRGCDGLAAGL